MKLPEKDAVAAAAQPWVIGGRSAATYPCMTTTCVGSPIELRHVGSYVVRRGALVGGPWGGLVGLRWITTQIPSDICCDLEIFWVEF